MDCFVRVIYFSLSNIHHNYYSFGPILQSFLLISARAIPIDIGCCSAEILYYLWRSIAYLFSIFRTVSCCCFFLFFESILSFRTFPENTILFLIVKQKKILSITVVPTYVVLFYFILMFYFVLICNMTNAREMKFFKRIQR